MNLFSSIKKLARSPYGFGLAILLLAILAYGIHIPWMGFYWDDWPWVWFSRVKGPAGMRLIDIEHRPVTGWVLYLGTLLSGDSPLGWQIYNLAYRVLGGFSLAWMLKALWPGKLEKTDWVVLLFLVYPGFGQQFVAVNNSRHLFPLAAFFLSLGLMIRAHRRPAHSRALTAASLAVSLLTMLTTEYYYGLELIRPLLLWLIASRQGENLRDRFLAALKAWLPYLLPLALIFGWRYTISKNVNYQITLFESLSAAPGRGLVDFLQAGLWDVAEAGLGVWAKLFDFPDPASYGSRARLYFWGLVVLAAIIPLVYFGSQSTKATRKKWALEAILLGTALLIIGPIPFWVTGLDIKANFPFDRLTLPMMLGSSLLLVGVLDFSLRWKPARWIVLSAIVGLAVGTHYQNAVTYRRDWLHQTEFFQHLVWRIPELQAGTALLANELPTTYSTDNSLTAPLNWIYEPDFSEGNLPTFLFYVDLRFGSQDLVLSPGALTTHDYRFYPFSGSPQQALVIYNQPPGCTRVLSASLHQNFPGLPADIQAVLPYASLDPIQIIIPGAVLPASFQTRDGPLDWCYSFEKADLARQSGDWDSVASFADQAFAVGYPDADSKHVSEYEVFIEGYARSAQWEKAWTLSMETMEIDPLMAPMLCDVWERSIPGTPESLGKTEALESIQRSLACEFFGGR